MVFSDPIFLIFFLPFAVILYRIAGKLFGNTGQIWSLILVSLLFYSVWRVESLPILLGSIVANFELGELLRKKPRTSYLVLGLTFNLLPLAYFKYAGWLTGIDGLLAITLPLGISFFTFQQIAYLVDCHASLAPRTTLRHYTLFVSFFPQLVAGPIVHSSQMVPQFYTRRSVDSKVVFSALLLLIVGLFKKVVIADNLAPYADFVFTGSGAVSILEAWTAALAYTLQLYFDFSGYCEMAMGIALLFGYTLPINFSSPYRSLSISEFWRRWHISLGAFFRQYVYIPLGGNRHGLIRTCIALFLVAFVSGIWHGAGVTFIAWGLVHGCALVVHRIWRNLGLHLPDTVALVAMLFFAIISWVVFRAPTMDVAANIWQSMLGLNGYVHSPLIAHLLDSEASVLNSITGLELPLFVGLLWFCATKPNVHEFELTPSSRLVFVSTAAVASILFSITSVSSYIYWSF